ncbi:hypothetical protein D3C72_1350130 [compost metagenome]
MARYLQFAARAFSVGAIILIAAIVSRQVYLRAAEVGIAGEDEEPAAMMLIRCETMHKRIHNQHSSADSADADEHPLARCRES